MSVNYFGSAQVSHAVVSGMKGRREGGILFVSSQGGPTEGLPCTGIILLGAFQNMFWS